MHARLGQLLADFRWDRMDRIFLDRAVAGGANFASWRAEDMESNRQRVSEPGDQGVASSRTVPSLAVNSAEQDRTTVAVRPFGLADRAAWNAFVHSHPEGTFFHLAEWQYVLQTAFGHSAHYLLAESAAGEIRGVLPLAQVKSLLFGNALVSTPFCVYGGIVALDAAAHAALERAACELAAQAECRLSRNAQPAPAAS